MGILGGDRIKKYMGEWICHVTGVPVSKIDTLIPGVALTAGILIFSMAISSFMKIELVGGVKLIIPSIVMALLIGVLIGNVVKIPDLVNPGVLFSSGTLLRVGIVCLGVKLTIVDIFKIGWISFPIIISCTIFSIGAVHLWNVKRNGNSKLGVLIAVGTAICGISAIIATSTAIEATEEETSYAVAIITIFGLIAMITYPFIGHFIFNVDAVKIGLWLGTSIHDTSQVIGASMMYSQIWGEPVVLETAILAKAIRNALMVIIIPLMMIMHTKKENGNIESSQNAVKKNRWRYVQYFPKFIIGFLILSLFRTTGDLSIEAGKNAYWIIDQIGWENLVNGIGSVTNVVFVMALAGVGLKTRVEKLRGLGIQPLLIGFSVALLTGLVSFLVISWTI